MLMAACEQLPTLLPVRQNSDCSSVSRALFKPLKGSLGQSLALAMRSMAPLMFGMQFQRLGVVLCQKSADRVRIPRH